MKTKHILTALALPAVFAACTADDIVNENSMTNLQGRAKLSENFVAKVSEGVESRYSVEGETKLYFNFETNDQFAAATIDEYKANWEIEDWPIVATLPAAPIPFTYNANSEEWKAPANMPLGVGHYLFLYPYDRNDVNRAAASYELPTVQKLYTEEDGEIDLNAAIEDGDKSFYSTVLLKGDSEVNISLEHLYTYPKFIINFDNGEKVTTVSKVVLEKNGGFQVKGGFNHQAVADLFANKDANFWGEDTEETDWSKVQTADLLTNDYQVADIKYSNYLVAELPLDAEVEEVTNNKFFEVRFMMPGFAMDSNLSQLKDYRMYIYTNNGAYSFTLNDGIEWKQTTKLSSKKAAFARGKSNNITITKDAVKKYNNAPYIVTSIEDWNDLVEVYGDEDAFVGSKAINVAVVGNELVLDETAEMPTEAEFKVKDLTVAGEVELCNVTVTNKLTVSKGATLTTCESLKVYNQIENKGNVVVAAVYDEEDEKFVNYYGVNYINNYGSVTVEKDTKANFGILNQKNATLTNNGTLAVYGVNYSVIDNAGTINMNDFSNTGKYKEKTGDKEYIYPTIKNTGKILTKGDVKNWGKVINEGTLSCKNQDGTFVNETAGYLDAKAEGLTYITENKGEVKVYAAFQKDLVIEDQNGTVTYATAESKEDFVTKTDVSYVNKLIVSDDLTIEEGTILDVIVEGDATITLTKNADGKYISAVKNLTVKEGKTAVLGSDMKVATLVVEEDAMVKVPADLTMEVTSANSDDELALDNQGEIRVAGSFIAANIPAEEGGIVSESGANAFIQWAEHSVLAGVKKAYKAALQNAIKDWAKVNAEMEAIDFDLYKSTSALKAKNEFNKYYSANNTSGKFKTLKEAFEAYEAKYFDVMGRENTKGILEEYDNEVANLTAAYKKDGDYETLCDELALDEAAVNKMEVAQVSDAFLFTSASKAAAGFKKAVINGLYLNDEAELTAYEKVMLVTIGENHAPEYTQVITSDLIYRVFTKEGITAVNNWKTKFDFDHSYQVTEDNYASYWDLDAVNSWIDEVAKENGYRNDSYMKAAKAFVEDNDLTTVADSWTYNDKLIQAIAADILGLESFTTNVGAGAVVE